LKNVPSSDSDEIDYEYKTSSIRYQFWILLKRQLLNTARNPAIIWVRLGQGIAMSLLLGSVFYQVGNDQGSIQKRLSSIFFSCVYQALSSMPSLSLFIEERGRFNRERSSGSYGTISYFLAATAASVPLLILVSFFFGSIGYW
jgi:ATP-binding cassette subfamily G (WHITE) protein 2